MPGDWYAAKVIKRKHLQDAYLPPSGPTTINPLDSVPDEVNALTRGVPSATAKKASFDSATYETKLYICNLN